MIKNILRAGLGLSTLGIVLASTSVSAQTRDVEYYLCLHAKECEGAVGVDESQSTDAPDTKGFRIGGAPSARPQVSTGGKATRPKATAPVISAAPSAMNNKTAAVFSGNNRPAVASSGNAVASRAIRKSNKRGIAATNAAVSNHKMLSEYGGGVSSNDLLIGFELNSDRLSRDARAEAAVFARALNMAQLKNKRFVITGHTDSSGGEAYNLILSQRRAESVVNYLVSQGVDRNRLEAKGAGYANPLPKLTVTNALNRRVEAAVVGE
jgi:outer membrane protein OmpA-like peptidoglycan-associated protein